MQSQGGKVKDGAPGHPEGHQVLVGHLSGREAGATIVRETAVALALIES